MWPFDRKKKTEEIRADTVEVEKTTPEITSAEILAALLGKKHYPEKRLCRFQL